MPNMRLSPPLKWHGGKFYLARQIIETFPVHTHYVEPFAGGLSVLLAKNPEGVSEVVNDLDGDLITFWRVLQHSDLFPEFMRAVEATPFSEDMWKQAIDGLRDYTSNVGRAWAFFVLVRQSLAGRINNPSFATLSRTRTRRGMNEQVSAWLSAVEGLPAVHERLKRVVVLNHDALEVIRQQDGPQTLFYLDPPYMHETREAPEAYRHEMTAEEHSRLLDAVGKCRGKVALSGYRCELYDDRLRYFKRHEWTLPNQAAHGDSKRMMTECLWVNW